MRIVSFILAVSMISIAAFADERDFSKRRERQSEKRPQVGFRADRSFGSLRGMDENYLSGLKEKIDKLEQQDIKDKLNLLIDNYSKILSDIKEIVESEAVKELIKELNNVEEDLRESLKEAGLINGYQRNGERGNSSDKVPEERGYIGSRFNIDIEKLSEAVNAVTDEKVKSELNALIEKYEASLTLISEAGSKTDEDKAELLEERKQVLEELFVALKDADIEINELFNITPERPNRTKEGTETDKRSDIKNEQTGNDKIQSEQNAQLDDVKENNGIFNQIIRWFKEVL